MKKFLSATAVLLALLCVAGGAQALDFDFSGTFTQDNDVVLLNFTVGQDSTITIFSSSWGDDDTANSGYVAGAGFDPILAIWDSSGNYVSEQDDGGVVGSTLSNGVSYTHGTWDSYYDVFLTAGDYQASIAQYDNFRAGNLLSDGFRYDNDPDFTMSYNTVPQPYFNGVWNDADYRTGDWEFHILNVAQASGPGPGPIPEPTTLLLLGAGLIGLAGVRRKA